MKRILWGMVVVIVPAFVLWGGISTIKGRRQNSIGTLNGKKITYDMYSYYIRMAQLHLLLNFASQGRVTVQDLESLAMDFLILSTKAKNDSLAVNDTEVIGYIRRHPVTRMFFPEGNFDQESYENFLRRVSNANNLGLTPRLFEEYMRGFLIVEKLLVQNAPVEISEEEVKELFLKDYQKAKIAYLFIPYENFKVDIGITPEAIEAFYQSNPGRFQREPKIKLRYAVIDQNNEKKSEILEKLALVQTFSQLQESFPLEIKETDFLGLNDPIPDIGWQTQINQIAFSLEDGILGPPIETEKGVVILQKVKSQEGFIPPQTEIEDEVRQALIQTKAEEETKRFSEDLLKKINTDGKNSLAAYADKQRVVYKETDYFKYYDYIEGLGLDEEISKIVFSMENNQIYGQPRMLSLGAYIIQLLDKTPFEENVYKDKKEMYAQLLKQNKESIARLQFITNLRAQADLKLYPLIR